VKILDKIKLTVAKLFIGDGERKNYLEVFPFLVFNESNLTGRLSANSEFVADFQLFYLFSWKSAFYINEAKRENS
jgi:hypothetical protein